MIGISLFSDQQRQEQIASMYSHFEWLLLLTPLIVDVAVLNEPTDEKIRQFYSHLNTLLLNRYEGICGKTMLVFLRAGLGHQIKHSELSAERVL